MKKQQSFTFIDGEFSATESLEILQSVFSSKIQFHQVKNFSSQERFGHDDATAVMRIPQLRKSIEEIKKMIETAAKEGDKLQLKSDIVINCITVPKSV